MDPDVASKPEKPKASLQSLLTPLKNLAAALKNLPIPKKLVIPALAGAVLLIAGGAATWLFHGRLQHTLAPQGKAVASASAASPAGGSAAGGSAAGRSAGCSGVVRDIYRQTVDEGGAVTLAEVRSEVLRSGVNCAPVPEIAAELKDLSPGCRDMVQYTFLGVRDGHPDIKVSDVRKAIVPKSVACEHDRRATVASVARPKAK